MYVDIHTLSNIIKIKDLFLFVKYKINSKTPGPISKNLLPPILFYAIPTDGPKYSTPNGSKI